MSNWVCPECIEMDFEIIEHKGHHDSIVKCKECSYVGMPLCKILPIPPGK